MAVGRVITGFSKPYVALYTATEQSGVYTVSYSNGQVLARGVSVEISPDSPSDNKFYADNIQAENAGTVFTGGTATITVDGLKSAAQKLVFGLATADSAGWLHYSTAQAIPYLGFGCIVRYMEDAVTSYEPLILPKIQFQPEATNANTQEEDIDWQTQALSTTLLRDDTSGHDWKLVGTACTTEAAAESMIKTFLAIS